MGRTTMMMTMRMTGVWICSRCSYKRVLKDLSIGLKGRPGNGEVLGQRGTDTGVLVDLSGPSLRVSRLLAFIARATTIAAQEIGQRLLVALAESSKCCFRPCLNTTIRVAPTSTMPVGEPPAGKGGRHLCARRWLEHKVVAT
ncbi:hypothetical protein C4D60_Mb04t17620 [Musa balbisiana]|uniref:Uncharacterized protein n=1 Tax=Musa balbisiana TaxID=52838 RepID=A0A4S8KCS4_MUSBA|nr:hypothetical protein C4D60_Mb04t17620 [Musa balbisiana]